MAALHGVPSPAEPPPTPLMVRNWRREAVRHLRLAHVAVREAHAEYEQGAEEGHTALSKLCNALLSYLHLPSMPLGLAANIQVGGTVYDVRAAAAAKLVALHFQHAGELANAMARLIGAAERACAALNALRNAILHAHPWQAADEVAIGGTLSLPAAADHLCTVLNMMLADLCDKADVANAAGLHAQQLQHAQAQTQGLPWQSRHINAIGQLLSTVAQVSKFQPWLGKGSTGLFGGEHREAAWRDWKVEEGSESKRGCPDGMQGLERSKGLGISRHTVTQQHIVEQQKVPQSVPAPPLPPPFGAEQLERRATVWLCVWLLQPHVHEGEREEALAGLGEVLAACE
ncbi:hypothetical protein DUNSADRAFT_18682 [Dunaliella salina]|uniref:Uncharacterized protein n=1 Tax=Dunaliella salina TaxID=3046 RepID=A0ABQ7FZP3_DUNSA|nr:hypothetical protein DUNSADRAFT_18682 [Dunaliella salina]|eukprot:KAF5827828.1 hypothetical protein DUNSADRAFT_18682 [Dunaliella salina]